MSMKRFFLGAAIFLALGVSASAATTAVEMLRDLFRKPVTEWKQYLNESKPILTNEFFENVERRIRWGIENNHIDDAYRFAMVGDFGSEVRGRPANFRIDLAEMFFKAGNQMMTGQIVDNILVTSPGTPPAKRAKFLKAQLLELQQAMFGAHELYLEMAKEGYEKAESFFRAGRISMLIEQETRGLQELKQAKDLGHIQAGIEYDRYKAALSGTFVPEVIPPVANTPGMDTTTGVTQQPAGPDLAAYVASAQTALAAGDLAEAKINFEGAYRRDKNNLEVVRSLGALLYRMGTLDDARAFLDESLRSFPQDATLWRYRANTMERLYDRKKAPADLDAAIKDYQKALQLDPNHSFLPAEFERAKAKKR